MLADQIRIVTAELAQDEKALSDSAAALEQLLRDTPATEPTPITAVPPAGEPAMAHEDAPAMEMPPGVPEEATSAPEASENLDAPVMEAAEEPANDAIESDASPVSAEAESADTPVMEATEADEHPTDTEMSSEEAVAPSNEEHVDAEMPAPTPIKAEESDPMVAAAKQDAAYTLIAYPFVRFSDLGQFQAALQKLAGVHDIQVRRFAQGTLEMRIGYDGGPDLVSALRTLETEVEDVREEAPDRLRLRLRASHDA